MNLFLVEPRDVDKFWPTAEPRIAAAVARSKGELSVESVYQDLKHGKSRLAMIFDAGEAVVAFVLHVVKYPKKSVLLLALAGGERLGEWCESALKIAEQMAVELGLDSVYVTGRRGWLKVLEKYGYSEYSTTIGKEIGGR